MRKIVGIIAGVLTGILLVGVLVVVLAVRGEIKTDGNFGLTGEIPMVNRVSISKEDVDKLESIAINYSSDTVELHTSTNGEIVLEECMEPYEEYMAGDITLSNNSAVIQGGERRLQIGVHRTKIKVFVPDSWQGNLTVTLQSGGFRTKDDWNLNSLNISTMSGSIRMENITTKNECNLKTQSGSVRVGNIPKSGEVQINVLSGSVHIGEISAETKVVINSGSGNINTGTVDTATVFVENSSGSLYLGTIRAKDTFLKSTSGPISVEGSIENKWKIFTISGTIRIDEASGYGEISSTNSSIKAGLGKVFGDISILTSSGSVNLAITEEASFAIKAKTTSGSIRSDYPITISKDKNRADGMIGEDSKYTVEVKTTSGSVYIEEA